MKGKKVIYIMGVSGCGKSTIGKSLAWKLGYQFSDGDDFHPEVNIQKMEKGIPLVDEDRYDWLESINKYAKEKSQKTGLVVACSALKEKYRQILSRDLKRVEWIYLNGTFELIYERISKRKSHFMPTSLLESQFATLEIPETCIDVSITQPKDKVVGKIIENLHLMD